MRTYKKIVLTGGPCAGKTTARAFLMQKLSDLGYHVLFVPEAPTLLMQGGDKPAVFGGEAFQRDVLNTTLDLEARFEERARQAPPGMKIVVICDRGVVDCLAYMKDRGLFEDWLKARGFRSLVHARDEHYDAVLHLVTAAYGAEAFYTTENNSNRGEGTLEEARAADDRTQAAWCGCPHWRAVPNRGTLDEKLKHLLREVCAVLGVPEPVETERKFLIAPDFNPSNFNPSTLGGFEVVDIEQFYLMPNASGEELRFRKRSQRGDAVCFRTLKRPGPDPASRVETEDFITAEEYEFGKQFKLPNSRFVRKRRFCFVYENQYFELDVFDDPKLVCALLELELAEPEQPMTLPPFLNVIREVTGEKEWSNYALATRP